MYPIIQVLESVQMDVAIFTDEDALRTLGFRTWGLP